MNPLLQVTRWALLVLLSLKTIPSTSQTTTYDSLWNDPVVEKRIAEGIEQHRKENFTLTFPNLKGTAEIEIQQVKHDFLFGANIFMLKGFKTEAQNRRYEEVFTSLFNLACVPFYWKTLEPEQGKPRFAANSAPIYRRPPPDLVLDFCEKNAITPKGHTLVWDNPTHAVPEWLPRDTSKIQPLIDFRITQLSELYSNKIQTWDVVNEIRNRHMHVPMPRDFALKAFEQAAKTYPPNAKLMINETTSIWYDRKREYSYYYLVIENLLLRKAKIDGIGLQCHFFHGEQEFQDVLQGKTMSPAHIWEILETYATFGKPLHISEITIPTLTNLPDGEATQAKVTRHLYRLWFSHPAVESIIWWNLADGTAVAGEDKWRGGFLNEDLSPKPSYHVLNDLINKEWKTNVKQTLKNERSLSFRGFHGEYLVKVKTGKTTKEYRVQLNKDNQKQTVE